MLASIAERKQYRLKSIDEIITEEKFRHLFTFKLQSGILLWLAEKSRLIAATGLSLLLTLGIISIINNVHDIIRMRACMATT